MTQEGDKYHDFDQICIELCIRKNSQVYGIFDACRDYINMKNFKEGQLDFRGSYHILYASWMGEPVVIPCEKGKEPKNSPFTICFMDLLCLGVLYP